MIWCWLCWPTKINILLLTFLSGENTPIKHLRHDAHYTILCLSMMMNYAWLWGIPSNLWPFVPFKRTRMLQQKKMIQCAQPWPNTYTGIINEAFYAASRCLSVLAIPICCQTKTRPCSIPYCAEEQWSRRCSINLRVYKAHRTCGHHNLSHTRIHHNLLILELHPSEQFNR